MRYSIFASWLVVFFAMMASTFAGGYYGSFYPKSPYITTIGTPRSGFGSSVYENSLGDSWNFSSFDYCYATLRPGAYDAVHFNLAANRNIKIAVTPSASLSAFMADNAFSQYFYRNGGYGSSARNYNVFGQLKFIQSGTTVGIGLKTSRWNGYDTSSAGTSYEFEFLYNRGWQSGTNPFRNGGAYSTQAWARRSYLGHYRVLLEPLDYPDGENRRAHLGVFLIPADSYGNSPYRYYLTQVASLSASTASSIFIIPYPSLQNFLNGDSVPTYYDLGSGWNHKELKLPPGRRYAIVVRDGINTGTSEGAQASVLITQYN